MGDSGSQMLGFALAALGLTASWKRRRHDRRDADPARCSCSRCRSSTRRSSRVVRLLEGRPIYQGGRDHSSHRLVRFGLSEKHAVLLLALIATRHRRHEPRLQRARRPAAHARRRAHHVRAARPVRELPRRRRAAARQPDEAPGLLQTFAVHWRRLVEVVVDFVLIMASRSCAAYADRVRLAGHDQPAAHRDADAADPARRALPRVHPVRPLPLDLALRRRARRWSRSPSRSSSPRSIALGYMVADAGHSATSRARSSSSMRSSARSRSAPRGSPSARS